MSRALQPGALRRIAAATLLVAMVGVAQAPAALAVTDDGSTTTTTSRSDENTAPDDDASTDDVAKENRSRRDADRHDARTADDHEEDGTAGTSGDAGEPQPVSTADENEGGANGDCPEGEYCSTRDGSASENGAGDGEATGKPCAGCVGKADNKNPQGQMPNADEDGNRGYECDDNQGVGQGNPAHTGCASDEAVAGEDTVDGTPGAGAVAGAEVAGAEVLVARPDAEVAGAARVAPVAAGPVAAILPNTGSELLVGVAALAGLVLLGAGTTLLRRRAQA